LDARRPRFRTRSQLHALVILQQVAPDVDSTTTITVLLPDGTRLPLELLPPIFWPED
jgi:hypothetical protein